MALASLGNNRRELRPIAWSGGFAALQDVSGQANAIWLSSDGANWSSEKLPVRVRNDALMGFGDRLVLAETHVDSAHLRSRVTVWWSGDGRRWERGGTLDVVADTPGYSANDNLSVLGDRLAIVTYIQPYSCCGGARPGGSQDNRAGAARPAVFSGAATRDEQGMWAWTSPDGTSWIKQRMRGLGLDSLGPVAHGPSGFLGIRGNNGRLLVRSKDGIDWKKVGPVPVHVDFASIVAMVASGDGFVLAADTVATRGSPLGGGPHLTIWQVSMDGVFTEVFDRSGWQLGSLASDGPAVVMTGHDYNRDHEPEHALALISTDGGATFSISAGWPGMDVATCLAPVAVRDHTAVASGACGVRKAPELLVAELPQP